MPRFYCPLPMVTGVELELPAGAARHVQVLRMQPGDGLSLFHGGLQAGGSGGASFMGLLWLFFWFGCLLAAVFSAVAVISQAKAYRQSTTVAALAAALTNGLGFALPWLIFYVM